MFLWDTKKLAIDIKAGKLTSEDQKNYFLAVLGCLLSVLYVFKMSTSIGFIGGTLEAIAVIIITAYGIDILYKTNGGIEGRDFCTRVTILSLPIIIKIIIAYFIFSILLSICSAVIFSFFLMAWLKPLVILTSTVLFASIVQIALFWRLNIYIKLINGIDEEPINETQEVAAA